jgi:hypothetical protein
MREFELLIDEALTKGLSPVKNMSVNSQFLYECRGFRCGKTGLEKATECTNPLPPIEDMYYQWPFPQFFQGESCRLMVIRDPFQLEDAVYSISSDFSTVTKLYAIDQLTYGQGSLMEFADFGKYVFMTNGVIMIYYSPTDTTWYKVTSLTEVPMMKTICNFKGQAVGGGIISDWYDCDETYYVWSRIGEMNFVPDQRNTEGYRRCPYGGEVLSVRRLGDNIVGYSSEGITMLFPVIEPAVTFGFREMLDIGLINQGANDGDLNRHVFVGTDYSLYQITSEGVSELDYSHEISTLAGEDIIVKYDKSSNDFYIGNSSKTYLLSQNGLTEVLQHPSAIWSSGNNLYGLPVDLDDDYYTITTWPFDFQYKGDKTVFNIETDSFGTTSPYSSVDLSTDHTTWKSPAFTPINNVGFSSLIASGNLFRFKLRFSEISDDFFISYIKVRYKMTDLRGIRGVYASGIRGQSS